MKIAIVLGTRPEIIKMSPIIRSLQDGKFDFFLIHTGQHYSYNLDSIFFEDLSLHQPKYNLAIKSSDSKNRAHIEKMIISIQNIFLKESPECLLIHGDTDSALSACLAASILNFSFSSTKKIIISHVEAGLRSNDLLMPEENNRITIDHLSNVHFVPTSNAKKNLLNEKIDERNIFIVGNTIVEALYQSLKESEFNILQKLNLKTKDYILATLHRAENVDFKEQLQDLIQMLFLIGIKTKLKIIFSLHPRTKKMLEFYNIIVPKTVWMIEPVGYLEFLQLEKNAKLILTDSGGIQAY